jgi:hypothetical protein
MEPEDKYKRDQALEQQLTSGMTRIDANCVTNRKLITTQ